MDNDLPYLIKYEFLIFLQYLGQQKTLKKYNKRFFILLSKLSLKIINVTNFHLIYLSNHFFWAFNQQSTYIPHISLKSSLDGLFYATMSVNFVCSL